MSRQYLHHRNMAKLMEVVESLQPSRTELGNKKKTPYVETLALLKSPKHSPTLTRLVNTFHLAGVVWHLSTPISVLARHTSVQLQHEVGWRQPRGAVDVLRQTDGLGASQFMVVSTPLANSSGRHEKCFVNPRHTEHHKTSGFDVCLFVCE